MEPRGLGVAKGLREVVGAPRAPVEQRIAPEDEACGFLFEIDEGKDRVDGDPIVAVIDMAEIYLLMIETGVLAITGLRDDRRAEKEAVIPARS